MSHDYFFFSFNFKICYYFYFYSSSCSSSDVDSVLSLSNCFFYLFLFSCLFNSISKINFPLILIKIFIKKSLLFLNWRVYYFYYFFNGGCCFEDWELLIKFLSTSIYYQTFKIFKSCKIVVIFKKLMIKKGNSYELRGFFCYLLLLFSRIKKSLK